MIHLFKATSPPQRDLFFAHNNVDFSWTLIAFAQRMASLAVREHSRGRVVDGLLALIIEDQRIDWRDSLPRIAVLYDAACKVSASPDELLLEASAFANNKGAMAVAEFTERSLLNKSLKVFPSYKEENKGPDGFTYVQSLRR